MHPTLVEPETAADPALDLLAADPVLRRNALADLSPRFAERGAEEVTAVWVAAGQTGSAAPRHLREVLGSSLTRPVVHQLHALTREGPALLLLGTTGHSEGEDLKAQLIRTVQRLSHRTGMPARAGVGPSVDGLDRVRDSARQAGIALRAARRGGDSVRLWSGLGPLSVLLRLPEEDLTPAALPEEVQRLLRAVPFPDMVRTLHVYLDHGGNGPAAAQALHIHRTTLYYRLGRISDLTGLDLADGRTRLTLHMGLALWDLIEADAALAGRPLRAA